MSRLDDLIADIPEQFQELARAHLPILISMAQDEVVAWIDLILSGKYETAYQVTNDRMTPSERIGEQKRLNALLEQYNKDSAGDNQMLRDLFRNLILILFSMLLDN